MTRISKDEMFMKIAILFSQRSTCLRKQVGAILVKDGRIISTGYNGVSSEKEHCSHYFSNYFLNNEFKYEDKFEDWIKSDEFYNLHREFSINENHAESNCIAYAAKNGISIDSSELYVTLSCCLDCAKLIVSSGIKKIFYLEKYDRDENGLKYLIDSKIEVMKLNLE